MIKKKRRRNPTWDFYMCFFTRDANHPTDMRFRTWAGVEDHFRTVHHLDPHRLSPVDMPDSRDSEFWIHPDVSTTMPVVKGMNTPAMCDFCNVRFKPKDPRWFYPARDFTVDLGQLGPFNSRGAWGACDACSTLIERDDYARLARRAQRQFNNPAQWMYIALRLLHSTFKSHRSGPREHREDLTDE